MKHEIDYTLTNLVREKKPLIHCITNYVTAGDVANMILACGASPIMADHPEEVKEITALSSCLLLNLGTPKLSTKKSMLLAGKEANRLNHLVILDPVGIGASRLRTETILTIIKEIKITVIRGNVSELKCLLHALTSQEVKAEHTSRGVDAALTDQITHDSLIPFMETARALSAMTGAVVVMTGATDIVSTWKETWLIKNGSEEMARITGSGCMLDGILAAYAAAASGSSGSIAPQNVLLEAAALATAATGLCGEWAAGKTADHPVGTGSFHSFFQDEVSLIDGSRLKGGAAIEIIK